MFHPATSTLQEFNWGNIRQTLAEQLPHPGPDHSSSMAKSWSENELYLCSWRMPTRRDSAADSPREACCIHLEIQMLPEQAWPLPEKSSIWVPTRVSLMLGQQRPTSSRGLESPAVHTAHLKLLATAIFLSFTHLPTSLPLPWNEVVYRKHKLQNIELNVKSRANIL